jgi:hypothetical protein
MPFKAATNRNPPVLEDWRPGFQLSSAERSHPEQCGFDTRWHLKFQSIFLWLAPRIPGIRQ